MPYWRGLVVYDVHLVAYLFKTNRCDLLCVPDPVWGVLRTESLSGCYQEQFPKGELEGADGSEENR